MNGGVTRTIGLTRARRSHGWGGLRGRRVPPGVLEISTHRFSALLCRPVPWAWPNRISLLREHGDEIVDHFLAADSKQFFETGALSIVFLKNEVNDGRWP